MLVWPCAHVLPYSCSDEMLIKARDLAAFQRPSERDRGSVRTWMSNHRPLVEKEQAFIRHREDHVTLHVGREWSGFDGWIESLLLMLDGRLMRVSGRMVDRRWRSAKTPSQWLFLTPELRAKTADQNVHYLKRSRVDALVGLIITGIILILLVLPVLAMYQLTTLGTKYPATFKSIAVLVAFTLLFSAAMFLLTKSPRHELFAASAAYCAVLVVFIGNVNNPSPGR